MRKPNCELQRDLLCLPLDKLRRYNAKNVRSRTCGSSCAPVQGCTRLRSRGKSAPALPLLRSPCSSRPTSVQSGFRATQRPHSPEVDLPRAQSAPSTSSKTRPLGLHNEFDDVITLIGLRSIRDRAAREKAQRTSKILDPLPATKRPSIRDLAEQDWTRHWENRQSTTSLEKNTGCFDSEKSDSNSISKQVSTMGPELDRLTSGRSSFESHSTHSSANVDSPSAKRDSKITRSAGRVPLSARKLGFSRQGHQELPSPPLSTALERQGADLFVLYTKGRMEMQNEMPLMAEAWNIGGCPYSVNLPVLKEIVDREVTTFYVELDDFVRVWVAYNQRMDDFRQNLFEKASHGEDTVDVSQLQEMLAALAITPMPGALGEEIRHTMGETGKCVTLEDFKNICNELYKRAGLSQGAHRHALEIFDSYAAGKDVLKGSAIRAALTAIEGHHLVADPSGFLPQAIDVLYDALLSEALLQQKEIRLTLDMEFWKLSYRHKSSNSISASLENAVLSRNSFLATCNALHQAIADGVHDAMQRLDMVIPITDIQPFLTKQPFLQLFDELGHVSSSIVSHVKSIFEECGFRNQEAYSFGEFYTVLLAFCRDRGFNQIERDELAWLYNTFATALPDVSKDTSGRLSAAEAKRILRWLCYTPSSFRMYDFMDKYQKDDESYLDLNGLMDMVADYRYVNMGLARDYFRTMKESEDGIQRSSWGSVPITDLKSLMFTVGHHCSDESLYNLGHFADVDAKGNISWREFLRVEGHYREIMKPKLKDNLGFTDVEHSELCHEFSKHTLRNDSYSDNLLYDGFMAAASKFLPDLTVDTALRKLLKESDWNKNNKIELREFLWIMRRLLDKDSRDAISRCRKLRKSLSYSVEDVRGLRDLFRHADKDLSGYLSFEAVKGLLTGLVAMNETAEKELYGFCTEVDSNQDLVLDFWEFLRLMKNLQNRNWRNLMNVAHAQVNRENEQRVHKKSVRRNALVPFDPRQKPSPKDDCESESEE